MANQTATEQLVLELINRARLDPLAEALRHGIALNEGVPAGSTISSAAKQPLAMNGQLLAAADGHSEAMVNNPTPPPNSRDFFEHNNPHTQSTSQSRIEDSGYDFQTAGENLAFIGSPGGIDVDQTAVQEHAGLFIDAGVDERGHRTNLMNPGFKEVGVGIASGDFNPPNDGDPITYKSVLMTQDFGARNANRILTGVAYNDTVVADLFYSIGEARAGVNVTAGAANTATAAAGGYELDVSNGALNVTFSGGSLANAITVAIIAGADNVKLDVVNGNSISSSASISLISGVTRATLLGIANLTVSGTTANDVLTGNRGSNLLNGKAGADTMRGLTGNDAYYVDNVGDRITGEGATHGTDNISASVSYVLNASASVETLRPISAAATTALNLTGNEFANTVIGNAGNNVLSGGAGADALQGAAGNDTYVVDNAGDTITETTGVDSIATTVSYVLAANVSVETLRTSAPGTTTAISLTGNNVVNAVIGNAGSNAINGGLRNDSLTGGGGNDFFTFNTTLSATTNMDTIVDFNVAQDTIRLENAVFAALTAAGTLAATAFRTGSGAGDANDRIIYNNTNGALLYDADGTGATAAVQFAKTTAGLSLTNADFVVV